MRLSDWLWWWNTGETPAQRFDRNAAAVRRLVQRVDSGHRPHGPAKDPGEPPHQGSSAYSPNLPHAAPTLPRRVYLDGRGRDPDGQRYKIDMATGMRVDVAETEPATSAQADAILAELKAIRRELSVMNNHHARRAA